MRTREEIAVSTPNELCLYQSTKPVMKIPTTKCGAISLDSSNSSVVGFASDRSVCLWDTRTNDISLTMKSSHFFPILCLDSNPNMDHAYVTGGSDGRLLFWDLRQPQGSSPLQSVGSAHAHHVTSVKYHPIHDQLLISSGTDCSVNLWRFQGVSSTPTRSVPLTSPRAAPSAAVDDGLVESYKRHEDAVYRCCWSRDGWSFASVSYDGLVMVNSVSVAEKYRILL
jgi:WD40 repeat protein